MARRKNLVLVMMAVVKLLAVGGSVLAEAPPLDDICTYWSEPQELISNINPQGVIPSKLATSVAIDSEDNWHVTYYDHGLIKYMNSSGSFPVTVAQGAGLHSMAIDSNDKLYVVYFVDGHSIMYTNNVAGSWSTSQEIASGLNPHGYAVGYFGISLAIDSKDNWHMVYTDTPEPLSHNKIKYMSSISAPITVATGDVRRCSIALDSNDEPHVVYFQNRYSIMYLSGVTGVTPQKIAATGFGRGVSLAIDSKDDWRIVYYDGPMYNKYNITYKKDSSSPVVLAGGNVRTPSIAVDSYDQARIVYLTNIYSNSVMYIRQEPCIAFIAFDIKPGSCPNPLNVKSLGLLPVAVLGSEDFDVSSIDAASIRLAGIAAIRSSFEDVATPVSDSNECECSTEGPDGFLDLTLKFETRRIVEVIGEVNDGDELVLELTGVLSDETPIEGSDCVIIRGRHKPINKADFNGDGTVDMADFAAFAENWLQSSIVEY